MNKTLTRSSSVDVTKSYVFLINRRPHKGTEADFTIPSVDEIIEPELGPDGKVLLDESGNPRSFKTRQIRYLPGERSIYVDEQSTPFYNDKMKVIQGRPIKAVDRVMVVSGTEVNKVEFLMKTNANGSNPNRDSRRAILFRLNDPESQAKKALENDEARINAQYRILHMPIEQLKPLMITLAKSTAEIQKISIMEINELRYMARSIADKDPKKFLESMSTDGNEYRFIINSGIANGVIKIIDATNSIIWHDGGILIQAPHGLNPTEHLVTMAKNDTKMADAVREIGKRGNTTLPNVAPIKESASLKPVFGEKGEEKQDWLDKWIYSMVKEDKITMRGPQYYPYAENKEIHFTHKPLKEWLKANNLEKFNELNALYSSN